MSPSETAEKEDPDHGTGGKLWFCGDDQEDAYKAFI